MIRVLRASFEVLMVFNWTFMQTNARAHTHTHRFIDNGPRFLYFVKMAISHETLEQRPMYCVCAVRSLNVKYQIYRERAKYEV